MTQIPTYIRYRCYLPVLAEFTKKHHLGSSYHFALFRKRHPIGWRREGDSNPRSSCPLTRVPGVRHRPLGHLSKAIAPLRTLKVLFLPISVKKFLPKQKSPYTIVIIYLNIIIRSTRNAEKEKAKLANFLKVRLHKDSVRVHEFY